MTRLFLALALGIAATSAMASNTTWNIHVRDFDQRTVDSYGGCTIGFSNIEPGPADANFLYAACAGVDQNDMGQYERPEGPPAVLFEEIGIAWSGDRYYEGLNCKFVSQRIENYGTHVVGTMVIECGWQEFLFADRFEE